MEKECKKHFSFKKQPSPDLSSLTIEGERIFLRSIEESYGPEIFQEFTAEITRFMFPKPADKIEETLSFISESRRGMSGGWDLVLTIIKKENNEFLGCCGFHGRGKERTPELGIWLKKGAHGKKYGREAIRTLTDWAAENVNFDYLIYPVDKANVSSRKIAESLGGVIFEEKIMQTMSGGILDAVVYKISV